MPHLCVSPRRVLDSGSTGGVLGKKAGAADRVDANTTGLWEVFIWGSSQTRQRVLTWASIVCGERRLGGGEAAEMRSGEKSKAGGVLSGLLWWKKVRKKFESRSV